MKRQKRDRLDRARAKGYQAGIDGRSKEVCPYQVTDALGYWLGGWRDAQDDRTNGTSILAK